MNQTSWPPADLPVFHQGAIPAQYFDNLDRLQAACACSAVRYLAPSWLREPALVWSTLAAAATPQDWTSDGLPGDGFPDAIVRHD